MRLPPEIERLFFETQIAAIEWHVADAKKDPVKHKLTLQMDGPIRYRMWKLQVSVNREVRYCYSSNRNVAGYFLSWRETRNQKTGRGKRDQFSASRRKKTCSDRALGRYRAHKARIHPVDHRVAAVDCG
jgi:hypothetical protein